MGISKRDKKKRKPPGYAAIPYVTPPNLDNLASGLEGLRDHIYFGSNWLDFMVLDNQFLLYFAGKLRVKGPFSCLVNC